MCTERRLRSRAMAGWRLTRWLLLYLAMLLADAAVVVAVVDG